MKKYSFFRLLNREDSQFESYKSSLMFIGRREGYKDFLRGGKEMDDACLKSPEDDQLSSFQFKILFITIY